MFINGFILFSARFIVRENVRVINRKREKKSHWQREPIAAVTVTGDLDAGVPIEYENNAVYTIKRRIFFDIYTRKIHAFGQH